jgi:hypothetical protein
VPMAHHGIIRADCESGDLLHIEFQTEPAWAVLFEPPKAIGAQLAVNYGIATIGTKEFLVPMNAVEIARFDKTLTKAEITFDHYRKYDADSSIHYDAEAK